MCRKSRQPCLARCFAAMSEVLELQGLKVAKADFSAKAGRRSLGASIVERDVQSAEGAHGFFEECDDVILSGDISSRFHRPK
jgi:hypothetical protein